MKIILLITILVIGSIVNAQYNLQWYASYDNPHPSYNDYGVDLIEDNLGNVYVTGTSFQINPSDDWRYDFATIKYNSNGDSVWVRRYNSSIGNGNEDRAEAIGMDGQNNIYVSGNTYTGYNHATIVKYDSHGNQIWVRNYYDSSLTIDILLFDMQVDNNGNVFLLCSYYGISRISEIIKYNTNGDIVWISKYYRGASDINNLISLTLDNSGNVYASGCTRDSGTTDRDYLTVKYNSTGVLQWSVRTSQTNEDVANCIEADDFGNVYVAGYSEIPNNLYDLKLIKYNSSGIQEWVSSCAGRSSIDLFGDYRRKKMIVPHKNGNIYLSFISYSANNYNDITTAKFNSYGELKWISIHNIGQLPTNDIATDIKMDNSNNVFVTGLSQLETITNNSFVILEYDTVGSLQKIIKNENQFPNVFSPAALSVNNKGDITATGSCLQNGNPYATDYFTVRYSSSVGINTISNSTPSNFSLHQNYPNPFNPNTNIKYEISKNGNVTLKIFNVLGNEISTLVNQKQIPGIYEVSFDAGNLSGGVYFYILKSEGFSDTKKMIMLK